MPVGGPGGNPNGGPGGMPIGGPCSKPVGCPCANIRASYAYPATSLPGATVAASPPKYQLQPKSKKSISLFVNIKIFNLSPIRNISAKLKFKTLSASLAYNISLFLKNTTP